MKKIISNRSEVKVQQMPSRSLAIMDSLMALKAKVKQVLPFVTTLAFLGTWLSMSLHNNNLHLREVLVCSSIIIFLMFFRALGPNRYVNNQRQKSS